MVKFQPDKIKLIRNDKTAGKSLSDIAAKYNCSKSTVSYYCRDIFDHPNRQYQTEKDVRQRLHETRKVRNHGHKLVPCTKCQKPIRVNKSGLCFDCYYFKRAKLGNVKQVQEEQVKSDKRVYYSEKLSKNYHPTLCQKSPSGYHRWIIDGSNLGTCFYCSAKEQMMTPKVRSFAYIPIY